MYLHQLRDIKSIVNSILGYIITYLNENIIMSQLSSISLTLKDHVRQ